MSDDSEIEGIIASAIQAANVTAPTIDLGLTRDQVYRGNEDSLHQAQAAIRALRDAGYQITKPQPQKP
jgi:hypothetical protein